MKIFCRIALMFQAMFCVFFLYHMVWTFDLAAWWEKIVWTVVLTTANIPLARILLAQAISEPRSAATGGKDAKEG